MNIEVIYEQSYYDKTDPTNYTSMMEDVVTGTATEGMELCMSECPVDTSLLRDSHEVESNGLEAVILNSTDYWMYVVYGTYKMSANNYPQRVVNQLMSSDFIENLVNESLSEKGIL